MIVDGWCIKIDEIYKTLLTRKKKEKRKNELRAKLK